MNRCNLCKYLCIVIYNYLTNENYIFYFPRTRKVGKNQPCTALALFFIQL